MTPLPSRLRASAQVMRTLDAVSLRPSSLALIDRGHAARIARELEEAAQALEVQQSRRDSAAQGGSEALELTGFHKWSESQGFTETEIHAAADAWLAAWDDATAAPSAQVAQEGAAGVRVGAPLVPPPSGSTNA